jgi:phage shock protein PspC (stress-responsive transcriptional regulator)
VSTDDLIGLVLGVLVIGYLIAVLVVPERF